MGDLKSGLLQIRPASNLGDMDWILLKHSEIFIPEFGWNLTELEGVHKVTVPGWQKWTRSSLVASFV
jgi:hypothetical protein